MTNLLNDPVHAARKIADFLETLSGMGNLELKSHILACNGHVQPDTSPHAGKTSLVSSDSSHTPDSPSSSLPCITVEFTGPDTPLLLARNGELLHAIEHVAAKILRLEPEEHDQISFDAEGFKANRDKELFQLAETGILEVRSTGRPYSFPPMTSRERRMLHVALSKSGLPTASSGEGPRRFVVLYPVGYEGVAAPVSAERAKAIRNSFRRR
ncbi:R3H domain-containing nucleic acid-binding protein [Granulicella sp. L60]|jgi:spoIIIJ-associated protein|uniref:Jag family protein n=1 Tax=Granulicella sp. L60 TaxID=1641866 RepID=UPI0020B171A6|nr:R3H domain-containing nucleic acid-binding protein [Granulicella sp. L60]